MWCGKLFYFRHQVQNKAKGEKPGMRKLGERTKKERAKSGVLGIESTGETGESSRLRFVLHSYFGSMRGHCGAK